MYLNGSYTEKIDLLLYMNKKIIMLIEWSQAPPTADYFKGQASEKWRIDKLIVKVIC